jgi:anti-sigma regulatory factor (Ser/Thr protein kinase)
MRTNPDRGTAARAFPSHPSSLHEVRSFVRGRAQGAGLSASDTDALVLAVSEACANAVLHSGSGLIEVTWVEGPERVEVRVADQGVFRRQVPLQEVEGIHGHGIQMMMALMDEVTVREGSGARPGTVVRLVKILEPG